MRAPCRSLATAVFITLLIGDLPVIAAADDLAESASAAAANGKSPLGMVWVPGGRFTMGSNGKMAQPNEGPPHRVHVDGFWIDATEVTNADFRKFVDATGYVTTSEKAPTLEEIMSQVPPGTPPPSADQLVAASLVFTPTKQAVPLNRYDLWWQWTAGASWKQPEGPDSNLDGRENHPVVHVSFDDAMAYAKWAGKSLPTEAQWEFAARGGLENKTFVWGDAPLSKEHPQTNIWQGEFPHINSKEDGYVRTAPVRSFPPNGFGIYDMSGNTWEWCLDWYRPDTYLMRTRRIQEIRNPTGPDKSYDPQEPFAPKHVIRGGSFLCSDSYCSAYRPSARRGQSPDTGMSHLGFRCVLSAPGPDEGGKRE